VEARISNFPRVMGSTQLLEGGSDEKLRTISDNWIRLMKRRAGLKKALGILGCLTPSFKLVIPQTPRKERDALGE
jgi:hypothetical protein